MKNKRTVRAAKRKTEISPQWEKVHRFRRLLNSQYPPPHIRRLRDSWSMIEAMQKPMPDLESCGSPFEAVNLCTMDGRIAPPEFRLAVWESTEEYYLEANAGFTLEDALIGEAVKKAGNLAMRKRALNQKFSLALLLWRAQLDLELTQEKAADYVVQVCGLKIAPETLMRRSRTVMSDVRLIVHWHTFDSALALFRSSFAKSAK